MKKSGDNIYRSYDGLASVGLLLFLGAMILAPKADVDIYRWVAGAGAVVLVVARVMTRYGGDDLRLKRLVRTQAVSSLFFVAATVILFLPSGGTLRDFIAFTLAGAVLQIYTSFAISRRRVKIEGEQHG